MTFQVEPTGEKNHACECCDQASRAVLGVIHGSDGIVAAYFAHWTVGQITTAHPGNFDLVIGRFDDASAPADRRAVAMH